MIVFSGSMKRGTAGKAVPRRQLSLSHMTMTAILPIAEIYLLQELHRPQELHLLQEPHLEQVLHLLQEHPLLAAAAAVHSAARAAVLATSERLHRLLA